MRPLSDFKKERKPLNSFKIGGIDVGIPERSTSTGGDYKPGDESTFTERAGGIMKEEFEAGADIQGKGIENIKGAFKPGFKVGDDRRLSPEEAKDLSGFDKASLKAQQFSEGMMDLISGGFRSGVSPLTGTIGGAIQPAVGPVMEGTGNLLESGLKKQLGDEEGAIAYENMKAKFTEDMAKLSESYEDLSESDKTLVRFVGTLFEAGVGGMGAKKVVKEGIEQIPKVVSKGASLIDEGIEATGEALEAAKKDARNQAIIKLDQTIDEGIEKGIRPSLTGEKKTIQGMEKFKTKARDAVKLIADNEDTLKLVDEFGEAVEGSPKTLKQFADSISQNKRRVYDEYSSLSKEAGSTQKLQLNPITEELNLLANNKVLNTMKPEIVKYANEKIAKFAGEVFSPEQAEDAIKVLNQSLDVYYRNPSYDTASKAYVDSIIANNLRKNLDEVIEGATGQQYQKLKNQYASLKAIEKDVVHRALVDARKNNKGLIDFTDIFSGGEAVAGILSLNPGMIAKAATQKGIKEYFKWQNNPNVIIKRMFDKVKKGKQDPLKARAIETVQDVAADTRGSVPADFGLGKDSPPFKKGLNPQTKFEKQATLISNQDDILYRGVGGSRTGPDNVNFAPGSSSYSSHEEMANLFGENILTTNIKGKKFLDLDDLENPFAKKYENMLSDNPEKAIKELKAKGFDGIRFDGYAEEPNVADMVQGDVYEYQIFGKANQ